MSNSRLLALALASLSVFCPARSRAVKITEDFSADPRPRGWQIFGDGNLFHWNSTNQNLEVTWDSSRTNSYFSRPLGTTLARTDDFSLGFDLRLDDIGPGADTNKSFAFELGI